MLKLDDLLQLIKNHLVTDETDDQGGNDCARGGGILAF